VLNEIICIQVTDDYSQRVGVHESHTSQVLLNLSLSSAQENGIPKTQKKCLLKPRLFPSKFKWYLVEICRLCR